MKICLYVRNIGSLVIEIDASTNADHLDGGLGILQMLEVETVPRRILWEFCCECWKGEYALYISSVK